MPGFSYIFIIVGIVQEGKRGHFFFQAASSTWSSGLVIYILEGSLFLPSCVLDFGIVQEGKRGHFFFIDFGVVQEGKRGHFFFQAVSSTLCPGFVILLLD